MLPPGVASITTVEKASSMTRTTVQGMSFSPAAIGTMWWARTPTAVTFAGTSAAVRSVTPQSPQRTVWSSSRSARE